MKNEPHTKRSLPPDQRVRHFANAHMRNHYDITSCSTLTCHQRGEQDECVSLDTWEVEIQWKAPRDAGRMTLFVADMGGHLTVTMEDGITPKRVYTLVPSLNCGRYAFDDPETGHDLTCGETCFIWFSDQWVHGHVEHSGMPTPQFPDAEGVYTLTGVNGVQIGYYFVATGGGICGLCAGMRVKY